MTPLSTAGWLSLALAVTGVSLGACDTAKDRKGRRDAAEMKVKQEPIQPLAEVRIENASLVDLGKRLFHEGRLAGDSKIACASCHVVGEGGDDGAPRSTGVDGHQGLVNAPTVLNSANNFVLFWDGRAATLEDQIDGPLTNADEMASSWDRALTVVKGDPDYKKAFAALFDDGITKENVKRAIAAYERALITPARFDRWLDGQADAISDDERRGYELFKTMGCVACHQGRNVGGNMFQRFGVMGDYFKDRGKITDADYGRFNVTKDDADRFVFRVPTLRNVALTAPYFHDGTAPTLPDAIRTMAKYQLGREIADGDVELIAKFLGTLTGEVKPELLPAGRGS